MTLLPEGSETVALVQHMVEAHPDIVLQHLMGHDGRIWWCQQCYDLHGEQMVLGGPH